MNHSQVRYGHFLTRCIANSLTSLGLVSLCFYRRGWKFMTIQIVWISFPGRYFMSHKLWPLNFLTSGRIGISRSKVKWILHYGFMGIYGMFSSLLYWVELLVGAILRSLCRSCYDAYLWCFWYVGCIIYTLQTGLAELWTVQAHHFRNIMRTRVYEFIIEKVESNWPSR